MAVFIHDIYSSVSSCLSYLPSKLQANTKSIHIVGDLVLLTQRVRGVQSMQLRNLILYLIHVTVPYM